MKVNDILVSTWGWEQTNVFYYQVVKATEKTVTVRQMARNHITGDGWTGTVLPIEGKFVGEPIRRLVKHSSYEPEYVSISSYETAVPWDGFAKEFTAYA